MASSGRRLSGDEGADVILAAMRGQLTPREMSMIGYSREAKEAITRLIEVSPVLEEAILNIADLCYRDGQDAVT